MRKVKNIKKSCLLIRKANDRTKRVIRKYKNLPACLFIAINASARMIDLENTRIRRSIWRGVE